MHNAHSAANPRILMVQSYFHPFCGGAENQALLLGESLRTHGVDVFVLTRYFKGLTASERIRGVPVYRYIRTVEVPMLFSLGYFLFSFIFMVLHRKRYDIIHCHILQGFHSSAAVIAGRLFKKKVVIKIANTGPLSDFLRMKKLIGGKYLLRLVKKADVLVVTSRQSEHEALSEGCAESQIAMIPNGVDTLRFRPSGIPVQTRTRIVCAGRLAGHKGLDVVLDAVGLLKRGGISLRVDIVGQGPERVNLVHKAESLGLVDNVVFHGELGNVEDFFDATAVFVQPSRAEGMSNVLLEAMAAGLPVIATRTGAAPDVIQDGVNGILIDVGSADQIRAAVQKIISDEGFAQRLGRQARTTVEACYSIERVAGRYSSLYQSLIKS